MTVYDIVANTLAKGIKSALSGKLGKKRKDEVLVELFWGTGGD